MLEILLKLSGYRILSYLCCLFTNLSSVCCCHVQHLYDMVFMQPQRHNLPAGVRWATIQDSGRGATPIHRSCALLAVWQLFFVCSVTEGVLCNVLRQASCLYMSLCDLCPA